MNLIVYEYGSMNQPFINTRQFTHWQLLLTTWFVYSAHATIVPHLPRYYDLDLHLTDPQIGMLMAVPALVTMLTQPVWGILADRYIGRTNTYRLGLSLALLFLSCIPIAYDLGGYGLLITTSSLMYACFIPNGALLSSLVFSFLGKKNANQYAKIRVAGSMSFAVTMLLLCPLFVLFSGWMNWLPRTGIFLGGTLFLTAAICFTFWNREYFEPETHTPFRSFLTLFKNRNLLVLYLSIFFVSSGTSAGIQYMGPYFGHLGYSDWFYGVVWFLGISFEIIISFYLSKLIPKLGLKWIIVIGFFADSIRWCGLFFFSAPELIIAFTLLHGFVVIALFFTAPIFLDTECNSNIRSTAQTMIFFALLAGQINGYLTSSWIVSSYSHLPRAEAIQSGFIWFALVSLLGTIVCAIGMKGGASKESIPPLPVEEMV